MTTTHDLLHTAALLVEDGWQLTAEEFEQRLADFVAGADDKIKALRIVCRLAEGRAATCKAEAAAYVAAQRASENTAARVKALAFALVEAAEAAGESLPGARLQPNGGKPALRFVDGFDPASLPFEMQRVVVEADSEAIRAAIARGHLVPGVDVAPQGRHLRWIEGR
jgi:hypothetical protein